MLNDIATILLDTSGMDYIRGYRAKQGTAPLKETLAAAMVKLTNWKGETLYMTYSVVSGTSVDRSSNVSSKYGARHK